MSSPVVCTCVLPLFERHVAGTASADEAARLATHALACPKCAAAMQRVADLAAERAAGASDARSVAVAGVAKWRARHPTLVSLGAVLVLVASGATLWYTVLRPRQPLVFVRGRGGDLRLMGTLEPEGTLQLAWPRSSGAAGYTVKVTGRSGSELTRSVSEPRLVLQASEVGTLGDMTVVVETDPASAERPAQSTSLALPKRPGR